MKGIPALTLEELTRRLAANPLLGSVEVARTGGPGGSLLRDVLVDNVPTMVQHPLRSVPRGYIITRQDKSASIFVPVGSVWTSNYIILQSSLSDTTIRLLVY